MSSVNASHGKLLRMDSRLCRTQWRVAKDGCLCREKVIGHVVIWLYSVGYKGYDVEGHKRDVSSRCVHMPAYDLCCDTDFI